MTNYSKMHKPLAGIGFKLLNLMLFTFQSLIFIQLAKFFDIVVVCFIISALATVVLLLTLLAKGEKIWTVKSLHLYALRGLLNAAGIVAWTYALANIGGNLSTAIGYLTPLITTALAILIYKEKLNKYCLVALLVGFIGAYITLQPILYISSKAGFISAICSSFIWACYDMVCKKQTLSEHYLVQSFHNFWCSSLILLPVATANFNYSANFILLDYNIVLLMIAAAIIAASNVTVLFLAYKFAPITVLMPFSYCKLIFMAAASYAVFGAQITPDTFFGASLIFCSTLFVLYQQRVKPKLC